MQERGAGDGFELADLAGQGGVPDAELAGRVVEAGLPREREEPVDALFGVRAGEAFQTVGGNAPGPPRPARGWAWPFMPCRTGMPALRAAAARASTGMPVSAAMEAAVGTGNPHACPPRAGCAAGSVDAT